MGMQRGELQDLIDQHLAGGADVLEARNMTFAQLADHCKKLAIVTRSTMTKAANFMECVSRKSSPQ